MNRKNFVFSQKLFGESLRQLRLSGILGTILLSIAAVLVPLSTVNQKSLAASTMSFSGLQMHPALLAVVYLFVPLMTILAFRFLNRRNESDFYLAAPFSRECLYLCRICAVLVWALVMIAVSSAVALLSFRLLISQALLNFQSFLLFLFHVFAACVFAVGALCIAVSITGTIFNNLIVALLLIFIPRILITVLTSGISVIPFLTNRGLPLPLSSISNCFLSPMLQFFQAGIDNMSSLFQSVAPGVYTLCLGLFYCAAGGVLFHFRQSETAGKPAPNKRLQAVFRITFALLITLPCCQMLFRAVLRGDNSQLRRVILYLAAVLVYFLYELIATKKIRGLLHTAPGLLIVAALYGAVFGSMFLVNNMELQFLPEGNAISSVHVEEKTTLYSELDRTSGVDYFAAKTAQVTISDETVNEILSRNLKDMTESLNAALSSKNSLEQWMRNWGKDRPYCQLFRISSGGTSKLRKICLNQKDWDTLSSRLQKDAALQSAYRSLPEWNPQQVVVHYISLQGKGLSTQSVSDVYNALRQEAKEIDFEEWHSVIGSISGISYSKPLLEFFEFDTPVGVQNTSAIILFDPLVLPKTCTAYLQACNSAAAETTRQLASAKLGEHGVLLLNGVPVYARYAIYNQPEVGNLSYGFGNNSFTDDTKAALTALKEILKTEGSTQVDAAKPFVQIAIRIPAHDDVAGSSASIFLPLPEGELGETLLRLLKTQG